MTEPIVTGEIEVIRDAHGIPHIKATSAYGALYGQGYVTGVDRAWQVEFLRLRGEGRTAEVLGPDALGWDEFVRRAQVDRVARRIYEASSPRTQDLLRAYAEGVSAGLLHEDTTSIELTELGHRPTPWHPWSPISVFIVQHIMFGRFTTKLFRLHACRALGSVALDFFDSEGLDKSDLHVPEHPSDDFIADMLDLVSDRPAEAVGGDVFPLDDAIIGSNAWGVAGSRTADGSPLIAGDPHRFVEIPGIYQQCHLSCPEFDVVGFAFAGVPGVPHFAHTRSAAWGITNAMADYQDVFVEQLGRDGAHVVARTSEGTEPVSSRTEQISVRDGDPVDVEVIETRNGAVLFGGADTQWAISLRTPMMSDAEATFDAVVDLLFAQTVADVEEALTSWVEPANRIVIADTSGRLTNHAVGMVPQRAPENYWLPVPGWDERYRWTGYAPASVTLSSVAGEDFTGEVTDVSVIANQRIDSTPPLQALTTECASPARADRIGSLLADSPVVSAEDCRRIQGDVDNRSAGVVLDLLTPLTGLTAAAEDLRRRILGWDSAMHADSVEAYLFAEIRTRLVSAIAATPALAGLAAPHPFPRWLDPWFFAATRIGAGFSSVVELSDAVGVDIHTLASEVLESVAADTAAAERIPTWGEVHVLIPFHLLDFAGVTANHPELSPRVRPEPLPLGGDAECVFANASAVGFAHVCRQGPVARYIWDVADRDADQWIVPSGAAGDAQSPHFSDQGPLWARGELISVVSDWSALREEATTREVVRPALPETNVVLSQGES